MTARQKHDLAMILLFAYIICSIYLMFTVNVLYHMLMFVTGIGMFFTPFTPYAMLGVFLVINIKRTYRAMQKEEGW